MTKEELKYKWWELKSRIHYMIPRSIREWYYSACCFVNPRNKWLTKKIPRRWVDKDYIIEVCLIESIREFVEGENALEHYDECQNNPEFPEWQKQFERELKEQYEIITVKLPELQKQIEAAWDKIDIPTGTEELMEYLNNPKQTYEERYGHLDKLEEEIDTLKTKVMTWAVVNRGKMWT